MIKHYFTITKAPLSALIAFSASYGYLLQDATISSKFFLAVFGVFFLSLGAATLNNVQDHEYDRNFSRTKNRPLALKLIPLWHALMQAFLLIILGLFSLYLTSKNPWLLLLGILSVFLYNGFYTPLKSKTVYAIIPGVICGMMPPYIGWVAAGGAAISHVIFIAMMVIGLWQIPHYWLIMMDQRSEFLLNHHIPSIIRRLSLVQLKKITFVWVASFSCLTLLLPLVGIGDRFVISRYLLLANSLLLGVSYFWFFIIRNRPPYKFLFIHLNAALAFVMLVSGADALL